MKPTVLQLTILHMLSEPHPDGLTLDALRNGLRLARAPQELVPQALNGAIESGRVAREEKPLLQSSLVVELFRITPLGRDSLLLAQAQARGEHPGVSSKTPKEAEAVTFGDDVWRAVVRGQLQRPDFNDKGPAIIFAQQVASGLRPAEPVRG